MKFRVEMITANGEKRSAEFISQFDATAVLVEQVKREVLTEGEMILMVPSPHAPRERREAYVPAIERIA